LSSSVWNNFHLSSVAAEKTRLAWYIVTKLSSSSPHFAWVLDVPRSIPPTGNEQFLKSMSPWGLKISWVDLGRFSLSVSGKGDSASGTRTEVPKPLVDSSARDLFGLFGAVAGVLIPEKIWASPGEEVGCNLLPYGCLFFSVRHKQNHGGESREGP
jgi:hypothetical protein